MTRQATILIVDDEDRNRRLLEVLLQPEGYRTVTAANGREALDVLVQQQIDLVLLDVMMPGMDGYELARLIKAEPLTRSIPIIMVTALVDRQTRLSALTAGVEEFLTKPVDRAELWLRVRNLLRLKEYGDFLADYSTVLEEQVAERTADLQRFRLAMDSTADAIFLTDRATMTFVEVNATASEMLGYTREELLRMGPADLHAVVPDDLEQAFDAIIGGSEASGGAIKALLRRKDGTEFQTELHRHARRSGDDWIIVGVLRDITEREAAEQRLQHLAHYDPLTGLPNRTLFYETLDRTLVSAGRNGWAVAIMFLDVDHFKNVNDTLGHATGDRLLTQIGNRLVDAVRLRDTVGRLGGDEFALILTMQNDGVGAAAVARKIREALHEPFDLGGNHVGITASIGVTMFPNDAVKPATLITYADTAMYGAKQAGRDTFRFFEPQMNIDVRTRLELEQALRVAIEEQQFVLHYQPKLALDTGRIVGLEALLRWQRPGQGLVPPNDFIPLLEETGLIDAVGRWVIWEACRQLAEWSARDIGPKSVAVNVSGRQFLDTDLDADIGAALKAYGLPAGALEVELTESSLMTNTQRTIAALEKLKARGVHVSIDDFGTGYSCLAYLRQFPVDTLKIDMAFIRHVTTSPADAAMTETIIRMAHSLGMDVIAEGVETEAQLGYLVRQGCDQVQGYYVSRPLPVPELEVLLRQASLVHLPVSDLGTRPTVLLVHDDVAAMAGLERLLQPDGYELLIAGSAAAALDLMSVHQVTVVVCHGAMVCADGQALLPRTKVLHPEALRIALWPTTDVAQVIETVNTAALYGFHAAPWDDEVLREQVREACRHHRRLQRQGAEVPTARPAPAATSQVRASLGH